VRFRRTADSNDVHKKHCLSVCIVCGTNVTRRQWRSKGKPSKSPLDLTESGNELYVIFLKRYKDSKYPDPSHPHSPTALCAVCRARLDRGRELPKNVANALCERLEQLPRKAQAEPCDGTSCPVCAHVSESKEQLQQRLAPREPPAMLPYPSRDRTKSKKRKVYEPKPRDIDDMVDDTDDENAPLVSPRASKMQKPVKPLATLLPKLAHAAKATKRGCARMQAAWRSTIQSGETDLILPRGGQALFRKLKRVFDMDFESQPCKHAKDGRIVICSKIHLLVAKYLHILGKSPEAAWRFKLNLDYGGDSLKGLVHVLFEDDPLKTHDFTTVKENSKAPDGNYDLLQSGVNGVLVVLDAKGVSESHEVILDYCNRLSDGITKTRKLLQVCTCSLVWLVAYE